MTRTYTAPAGASSITVHGKTYEVNAKGKISVEDEGAHAELLSHGYTYGDAPKTAPTNYSAADLAQRAADLATRETDLALRLHAVEQREAALAAVAPPPPPAPDAAAKPAKGK